MEAFAGRRSFSRQRAVYTPGKPSARIITCFGSVFMVSEAPGALPYGERLNPA
jgi:hypothetical protein